MSAPARSGASRVGAETLARVRSVLGRLTSLDDVTEIRVLAISEARLAMRAGDEERVAYCHAVAGEARSILEAATCQCEPPRPGCAA